MGGIPSSYSVGGQALNAEEYELIKGRPGDVRPFTGGGGMKQILNDVNAETGIQRVMDFRAGRLKPEAPAPPSAPPESNKAQKKVDAKRPNSPVSAAGGASKRTRASKGATATMAKSVLSNNPSDNKLG
tara:strand:- start:1044 stop:1430 length:387 start_codon:yes stop_codon:yes gene_type:complete